MPVVTIKGQVHNCHGGLAVYIAYIYLNSSTILFRYVVIYKILNSSHSTAIRKPSSSSSFSCISIKFAFCCKLQSMFSMLLCAEVMCSTAIRCVLLSLEILYMLLLFCIVTLLYKTVIGHERIFARIWNSATIYVSRFYYSLGMRCRW